jgi:hypothetical protein
MLKVKIGDLSKPPSSFFSVFSTRITLQIGDGKLGVTLESFLG